MDGFEKHPLHYTSFLGDFMESLSSFLISCDPYFDEINSNRFAKTIG